MLSWLWHSSGLRWFVVLVSGGFLGKLRWFPSMTLVWPQRCRRRWLSAGNESRSEEETRRREDFDIEVVIGVGSGGADDWRRIVKEKAVVFVDCFFVFVFVFKVGCHGWVSEEVGCCS